VKTVLTAAALLTPLETIEQAVLVMEDGVIAAVGPRDSVAVPADARQVDFPDAVLAPGFVDVHIHGGAGHDVMEGSEDGLRAVETLLAKHGVTTYCPTTVTAPVDKTLAALEKLGQAVRKGDGQSNGRAYPAGIHLEGPFISKAKCGVHPLADIAEPNLKLFQRLWQASQGTVNVMTVAPELPGAAPLIELATKHGIRVSLGHSNAGAGEVYAAREAGARHATHTFNAMRRMDHRDPGIVAAVLSDPAFSADIIADGVHVAPEFIRLFLAAKGEERAVLITDAISATGMPDGKYKLGTFEVEVKGLECRSQGRLAGSVLTMDAAIRNIVKTAGWELRRAVRLASLNPAKLLGIDDKKGSLEAGKDADVVVLTRKGEVVKTFIGGREAGGAGA
jgi:N-acetylglucosamine-6-phosphate deacetylase